MGAHAMRIGKRIGRYEVGEKIGSGGMGEVYIARDIQLDRDVAIKVLLPEIARDAERLLRFKREAKIASALNHPNIITIHEITENDGQIFIVSEYVVGTTLREKIFKNQLTLPEILGIALQVADALAAAHDSDIVHRDIKPENIMIRRDGYAKVLDFGLAKQSVIEAEATADYSTVVDTREGVILGSVSYMSPEQIRKGRVDRRTDIWSLGVVLYEMLTGRNPFKGDTAGDSIAAILNTDPEPIEKSSAGLPIELETVFRRALEKDIDQRYQDIYEFSDELKAVRECIKNGHLFHRTEQTVRDDETVAFHRRSTNENPTLIQDSDPQYKKPTTREAEGSSLGKRTILLRRKWLSVLVACMAAILLFGFYDFFHPNLFPNYYKRFENIKITRLTDDGNSHSAAISADGSLIAFVRDTNGERGLILRNLKTGEEKEIEPPGKSDLIQPTFSRDGKSLFFVKNDGGVGILYETWLGSGEGLMEIARKRRFMINVDSRISFSPDGYRFAFIRRGETKGDSSVFIADRYSELTAERRLSSSETAFKKFKEVSWQNTKELFTVVGVLETDLIEGLTQKTFGERGFFERATYLGGSRLGQRSLTNFTWLNDGTYFYLAKNSLGQSRLIHYRVPPYYNAREVILEDGKDYSSIDVAADGNMILATQTVSLSTVWSYEPGTGMLKQLLPESSTFSVDDGIMEVADDKIAYTRKTDEDIYQTHIHNGYWKRLEKKVWYAKARQLFVSNSDGTQEQQLTFNGNYGRHPVVTSDGKHILFVSGGTIVRMDSDGENLTTIAEKIEPVDKIQVTPDGKTILYTKVDEKPVLMKVSTDGGLSEPLIPNSTSSDFNPVLSRDAVYLAYRSSHFDKSTSAHKELVKVVRFDNGKVGEAIFETHFDSASNLQWSPDSKSLCFIKHEGVENISCYSISDKKENSVTEFESGKITGFTWSRDGKRLLIVRTRETNDVVLIQDADRIS